jgi:hypothetical protein
LFKRSVCLQALVGHHGENGSHPLAITVVIQTAGASFRLGFQPNDKVAQVKKRIQDEEAIAADHTEQQLIFSGEQLEDGRTLNDYNIQEESVLHLVLYARGGAAQLGILRARLEVYRAELQEATRGAAQTTIARHRVKARAEQAARTEVAAEQAEAVAVAAAARAAHRTAVAKNTALATLQAAQQLLRAKGRAMEAKRCAQIKFTELASGIAEAEAEGRRTAAAAAEKERLAAEVAKQAAEKAKEAAEKVAAEKAKEAADKVKKAAEQLAAVEEAKLAASVAAAAPAAGGKGKGKGKGKGAPAQTPAGAAAESAVLQVDHGGGEVFGDETDDGGDSSDEDDDVDDNASAGPAKGETVSRYIQVGSTELFNLVYDALQSPWRRSRGWKRHHLDWALPYPKRAETIEHLPAAAKTALAAVWRCYFLCTGLARGFRARCRWGKVRTARRKPPWCCEVVAASSHSECTQTSLSTAAVGRCCHAADAALKPPQRTRCIGCHVHAGGGPPVPHDRTGRVLVGEGAARAQHGEGQARTGGAAIGFAG